MSMDPDWESDPGRPNGYQKRGRKKMLCCKELSWGLKTFLVLDRPF